jgi:hypothetical protein
MWQEVKGTVVMFGILGSVWRISLAFLLGASSLAAGATMEVAAGIITPTNLGGGQWQYNIELFNESGADNASTTIGTFWFSWAPGQEFMEAVPTDVMSPAGWTEQLTGSNNSTDGTAIQWVAMSGNLLHAGQSLSGFQFDSTENPSQITGPSSFFQHEMESQSAAYTQGPFSDTTTAGDVFDVTFSNAVIPPPIVPIGPSSVPLPAAAQQTVAAFAVIAMAIGAKKVINGFSRKGC